MEKDFIMALDLGTTAEKCVIYDKKLNAISEVQKEIKTYYPSPGAAEINANDFLSISFEIIKNCIKKAKINPKKIAVVSIDSLMGGVIGIDKDYNPVTYYDTAMDTRAAEESVYIMQNFADFMLKENGSYPIWGHKLLYWKKQKEWDNISKFIHPVAYVAGSFVGLSSKDAFIDQSFLSFSAISDLKKSEWSYDLCKKLDISIDKLPKITKATEIIGEITKEVGEKTNLYPGTPVCAGCGDVTASFIGAGILNEGDAIDISGTANILAVCVEEFHYNGNISCIKSPIEDKYYLMTSHVLGGRTHKWFIEEFFHDEKILFKKQNKDIYSYLDKKASKIPIGSNGLISIDDLQGRFFPPKPFYKGVFIGHTWYHTKFHFYRSILESIAYDYKLGLEVLMEIIPSIRLKNIITAGSGSKSRLWMQIKSDLLKIPYSQLPRSDISSMGAALVGGKAIGLFNDIRDTLYGIKTKKKETLPNLERNKEYNKYFSIYKNLIRKNILDNIFKMI